jgi:Cu+-exporting ATPase
LQQGRDKRVSDDDQQHQGSNTGNYHEGEGGGEEEHSDSREKLLIVLGLALTIPIVLLELFYHSSSYSDYISFALATPVQVILGKPFYARFYKAIKLSKAFTTDTLVVLSTSVAYGYSIVSLLTGSNIIFFEASASVLTIFTIGEYLESRVLRTTSESIRRLLALKPKSAVVVRDGKEVTIDVDDILVGDIVVVKPGERIASDGEIVYGESSVDESMITGESIPVDKKVGDKIIGGTINKNGYLRFKATNVGSDTILAHIVEIVKKARGSKAPVQRIADRAVHYFIPIVLSIALAASLYWFLVAQQSIAFVVTVFATILVVSCPCALGIATPMVVSLGIDKAAREGVLIKGGQYVERLSSVDVVVFDKTGTLTKGKPEVTDIIAIGDYNQAQVLQLASSAEIKSEHPIAQAIVKKAQEYNIAPIEVSEFTSISGHGVVAMNNRNKIFVGSSRSTRTHNNEDEISERFSSRISELELEGKTVIVVFLNDRPAGIIAIADTLRTNAKHVIDEIKSAGKQVILMSGDNERTANAIASKLGIDDNNVLAQVLPETKAQKIKELQEQQEKVVAMVGDGINDAPALTQADIGIAMGSGTDVAMASGHVILMKDDLAGVLTALKLGKYALKKIKENLAMSFAYNVITISIAAGVLYSITNSLILTPALAALGWVVSDSAVFGNSLLLRRRRFSSQI